jgi:hypothetical protein
MKEIQHNIIPGTIIEPDNPSSSIAVLDMTNGFTRLIYNKLLNKYEAVTDSTVAEHTRPPRGLICFLDIIPNVKCNKNRLKVVVAEETKLYARVIQ